MRILGIETSCDDTGIALYDTEQGLIAHALFSQLDTHQIYGGIVPELASRDHIRKVIPLIKAILKEANTDSKSIDGVAYTAGPGLAGALLVGASIACSMAWALNIPTIPVHHMEGHLLSPMLEDNKPEYPFLALLVSGGHTLLVEVRGFGDYTVLGETLDDAVGEAFDKTAKLLGLPYPGGPEISMLAKKGRPNQFKFPKPMINRPGLDFSFSGLKTFVSNTVQAVSLNDQVKADIALAFEQTIADTLLIKTRRALEKTGFKSLVVSGGVSANQRLRHCLISNLEKQGVTIYFPRHEFCTDNGAMIAYVGAQRFDHAKPPEISIHPRWSISQITQKN